VRKALVGALIFFFTIAALSRILTAKQVPGLIGTMGDMLANLFKGAGN
jgi:hypothetical protein